MKKTLSEVKNTFKIAGIEFIKFPGKDGEVIAVAKESLFDSRFGDNNDLRNSDILKKLQEDILPKIEAEVGAENVLEFETDLLSLDGLDTYGTLKSKISIPTIDFYRANARIFDEYKLDDYWWLATPDSTPEHANDRWTVCVAPRGYVYSGNCCGDDSGVRPILHFVSSISVSCEE